MALTVVLLCLLVQRVFAWEVPKPELKWFLAYTARLETLCVNVSWFRGLGGIVLLFALFAVGYGIVIGILEHFLGLAFTFLFHALVLWYYLDAKPLKNAQEQSLGYVFLNCYQHIFVILFWYILIGPLGVILYAEARHLEAHLQGRQKEEVYFSEDFLQQLSLVRSLFDWVPVRLLGLSYALVGQFRPVFNYWYSHLLGLPREPDLVIDYGMIALAWDPNTVSVATSASTSALEEIEGLVTRTIIVWLVVLAVFTLGQFI